MFKRLSKSLGRAADLLHANDGLRRGRLLLSWVEAVGPGLARQAAPAEVQGDTLHLVCSGPAWSQEIQLRQKEILLRLNRLVGNPPLRRLRCRVGRVRPVDKSSPIEQEPPYPWDSVEIDDTAKERIDRLVGEIREPELADRLRRVLVQLERRRLVAFAAGAIACGTCGAPTPSSPCRSCRREQRVRRRLRIMQRLGQEPWLTRSDLQADFPDLRPEEFLEIRTMMRSRMERDIWSGIRALPAGAALPDRLRSLIVELVMLTTGLPAHRLDARHVRHALCPTLARSYLEDKACGPLDPSRRKKRPESDAKSED